MNNKNRAFLKWAGGKFRLVDTLKSFLPDGERLVEPFVGAGSIFLNTNYSKYLLCDINQDLINLYKILKKQPELYIKEVQKLFSGEMNNNDSYYDLRAKFNASNDPFERSLYFLYLNRHCFNGLCRYNKMGGFNVPFGSYKKPYFPEVELNAFAEKSQGAEFKCIGYEQTFAQAKQGDVIYCDPPYAPLSTTASFTAYAGSGFSLDDQALLAKLSRHIARDKNIPVVISNHDIPLTRELYHGAHLGTIQVQRWISQKINERNKVDELIALYDEDYHFDE